MHRIHLDADLASIYSATPDSGNKSPQLGNSKVSAVIKIMFIQGVYINTMLPGTAFSSTPYM